MNEKSLQANIEAFRELINHKGWSIATEKEGPSGYQITVTDGVNRNPVSFYLTGKILIQGKAGTLQAELQLWMQEQSTTSIQLVPPLGSQLPSVSTSISRTVRFFVSLNHIDQVKELLLGFSTQVTVQELSPDSYQVYRIDIHQGNERIVATQYKSGTLLIQGRTSELFEDICKVLENILSHSFAERGASYVPDSERDVILEHMNRPQTERKALDWVYTHLGQHVYEFLPNNDRETFLSGAGLFLSIEETNLKLSDYSIIVMPFARSYEGFIIQLAIRLDITNEADIQTNAESMKAGDYLNQIKDKIEKTDKVRYGGLVDTLQSVWRDVRNKVMHSDPVNPPPHPELMNAAQDIETINRAMRRSYEYLVERGIIKPTYPKLQIPQQKDQGFDFAGINIERLQAQLKQDGYEITASQGVQWIARKDNIKVICPQGMSGAIKVYGTHRESFTQKYIALLAGSGASQSQAKTGLPPKPTVLTTKATGIARIGLDESGKGDYFGPLVVGAVHVDEQSETQLIALGVRDSKRLPDNRILTMAEEIKKICSHSVVPIGPKRYNELYDKIQNLNRLLAWGHARSLENVLKTVACAIAVADQFGDESFILNALMEKGRQIKLEQRPRAEEDVAVAAASILARAEFVRRLEQLSKQIGKTLPKGASDPLIVTVGREIVAKGGRDALAEVAKLHFKTTEKILQSI